MVNNLNETVELMLSSDYKDRFKAEYYQLEYRVAKLKEMLRNWDKLDFTPACDKRDLRRQLSRMRIYLNALEIRAKVEGIEF